MSANSSRRFHSAFAVADVQATVVDCSARLGCPPELVVRGEYALWRTSQLNLSVRRSTTETGVRHLGWEDSAARASSESICSNGLLWERFSAAQ